MPNSLLRRRQTVSVTRVVPTSIAAKSWKRRSTCRVAGADARLREIAEIEEHERERVPAPVGSGDLALQLDACSSVAQRTVRRKTRSRLRSR
jgi:hypothetical protein